MRMITECLSQTQIVTNLLRLQNTTFQTCSRSKYSPIIPRLIFKASLFSPSLLPPQIPEPRAAQRERERQRRWGGAFKSSVPWVVGSVSGNLSHPVYAGQISAPGPQRAGTALSVDTAPLSLFYLPPSPWKISSLQTFPRRLPPINTLKPKANKHATSGSLRFACGPRGYVEDPDKKESFLCRMKCGHTTPPLISRYRFNTAMVSYLHCPISHRKLQRMKRNDHACKEWEQKSWYV